MSAPSYIKDKLPSRAEYSKEKYPLLSDEFWDLITRCWNIEPGDRPTIHKFREELRELRVTDWTSVHS